MRPALQHGTAFLSQQRTKKPAGGILHLGGETPVANVCADATEPSNERPNIAA